MKNLLSLIPLFLFFIAQSVLAQQFTARVNQTSVNAGQRFQIDFVFEGSDINNVSGFQPPNFGGLKILSGPNISQSMSFINGQVSASLAYVFYVVAEAPGKFTVGSAKVQYKGETLTTKPITITAGKGTGNTSPGGQGQTSQEDLQKLIAQNLFISATADRSSAYIGEQVNVTYKLYTRLSIASVELSKLPQYKGFWAEELESPRVLNFTTEVVNGVQYRAALLKRAALFPTEAGKLDVTPFELTMPVLVPRRSADPFSIFDDPFFSRPEPVSYTARSNTISIQVKPLPESSEPSFNGVVGDYNLTVSVDTSVLKTMEPITLKVTVNGKGNIKLLELPKPEIPGDVEVYDPKTSEKVTPGNVLSGEKTFEYILIPKRTGQLEIPPLKFTYFDPKKGTFVTRTSQGYSLNIRQGSKQYVPDQSASSVDENDLMPIITAYNGIGERGDYFPGSLLFWVLILLPLTTATGYMIYYAKTAELRSNRALYRLLKAHKTARIHLKNAEVALKASQAAPFYASIAAALFGYLEDKLTLPKADFTLDRVTGELNTRGVSEELVSKLESVIQQCEYARFAPSQFSTEEMNAMLEQTRYLIPALETELNAKEERA